MRYSLLIVFLAFAAVVGSLVKYLWFEDFYVNVLFECAGEGCEADFLASQSACDIYCDADAVCTPSAECHQ